ncbi:nuclease SbcCD subunit C [Kurthia zopfii]|uniref:Nuclease SbcCD subunit C n=1 Tax=Kurthia zopfii TaxID=1650 RepID=A0A8B4QB10_9BACL|nr:SMC family ATPase [Kurthia zopfii]PWI23163.1 hypothetical protein DF281_03820 [Kurthia zopfii]TDR41343.1 exonuclease SbcC [Kurthia zopfii]GEK29985.1 nuclease SbcCD subunit C [Kurthia zopfii]STX09848.1 Nuclease sbcCD subunit C [Kurthia zopfii]
MKPIKLSMTAFGPYRDTETIDFTELESNQIFVISGATGAGKTTIFDGICFALYGSVSGEERENAGNVRSDFATDDLHTSVELVFQIKGKKYRILRQIGHVKKGNKSSTGDKTEFVEIVDGQEIPVLDSHRVRDLNLKLEELIGLTKDQFKQIVMLPQGEFRKLLTSDSKNKEAILRKIFKTESFDQMTNRLKSKKTEAEKQMAAIQAEEQAFIQNIQDTLPLRQSKVFEVLAQEYKSSTQLIAGLQEEAEYYEELTTSQQALLDDQKRVVDQVQKEFNHAEQFNKELALYEQAKIEKTRLESKEEYIQGQRNQLTQAEKAEHIIPYEQTFRNQRMELVKLQEQLTALIAQSKEASQRFEEAKKEYDAFQKNMPQQQNDLDQLKDWNRILPFYAEVTQLQKQLQLKTVDFEKMQKDIVNWTEQSKIIKSEIVILNDERKKLKLATEKFEEVYEQKSKVDQVVTRAQKAEAYKKDLSQIEELQKNAVILFEQAKVDYSELEKNWISSQAYILAEQLVDGEPCPVCGSKSHEKMHDLTATVVTKEDLEAANEKRQKSEKELHSFQAKIEQLHELIAQENQMIEEVTTEGLPYLLTLQQQLSAQLHEIQNNKSKLNQLEQTSASKEDSLEKMRNSLNELNVMSSQSSMEISELQLLIREKTAQLPKSFEHQQQLENSIAELMKKTTVFEREMKNAITQYEIALKNSTSVMTSQENQQKYVQQAEEKLAQAEEQFKAKVLEAGFENGKEYTSARLLPEQMTAIRQELEKFSQQLFALNQQIEKGKAQFDQQEKFELEKIQLKLSTETAQLTQRINDINNTVHLTKNIARMLQQMKKSNEEKAALESRAGNIIKLYDLLSGKNTQKISFERYLQIEYLEQIIQAANERLLPLSNGQYRLSRSERLDSNGKQSGLSLDVYDTYTGQERDVKTLSGGEQFNASLCLALGMSDMIQSFRGNVQMETMFVDEGFGTLDEEALAKAIDTLVELQKTGRMIGIISHVAELKDTIPATLLVKKSKEGYSHTQFMIK